MAEIDVFFKKAIEAEASDMYLIGDQYPIARVDGELLVLDDTFLPNAKLDQFLMEILTKPQQQFYIKNKDYDFAYTIEKRRFRVNIHFQNNKIGLTARLIAEEIPSIERLGFTNVMRDMTTMKDGLVLVTGPTGSGKSTTLGAMVNYIHEKSAKHILTMEDPIEYVYGEGKSIIEQREIGKDTPSFASALKYSLRQDPDVILVGEMRDPETIQATLTAAETGHLVFSTLHTYNAPGTIERIISVFPEHKQQQLLIQLAATLRAVVSQILVPRVGGGRIAVREILLNTVGVANLIRNHRIEQIKNLMQTGSAEGMITMDASVEDLYNNGLITQETYSYILEGIARISDD